MNVTGEYPSDRNTPSLTVPFNKTAVGAPIVKGNLADKNHPINCSNISGKTRGASILLDDDSVHVATGHRASDPWVELGAGSSEPPEPEGMVKSVNGVTPDESGEVTIAVGKVNSVNGVEPDEQGNVKINAVQSVNGVFPDAQTGNVAITGLSLTLGGDVGAVTVAESHSGKLTVLNGTGEAGDKKATITMSALPKKILCGFVGNGCKLKIAQGTATQFICEGDWAQEIPAGRVVMMYNDGGVWVLSRSNRSGA